MNLEGGLKQEHLKDPNIALTLVRNSELSAFRAFSPQLVTKIAEAPTMKEKGLTYIVVEDASLKVSMR